MCENCKISMIKFLVDLENELEKKECLYCQEKDDKGCCFCCIVFQLMNEISNKRYELMLELKNDN